MVAGSHPAAPPGRPGAPKSPLGESTWRGRRVTVYAVPFHLHRAEGKRLGLDAFFWPSLAERYRVVLLVHPAEKLLEEPPAGACRLPVRVGAEAQAEELEAVARRPPPPVEAPRPSLLRRLAELLVPPKLLVLGGGEARVPEEAQARSLARMIGRVEPAGGLLWGLFYEEEGGALLPRDPVMGRIYRELRRRDPGYVAGEEEARRACRS